MTATNLTSAQIAEAVAALKKHGTKAAAAKALGIPVSTFKGRLRAAELPSPEAKAAEAASTEARAKITMQDTIRDLQAQIKTFHREEVTAANVREIIFGLASRQPTPPSWLVNPKKGASGNGVPCTIWSDWHWGEVVNPTQVNGINEFNLAIAHARLKLLVERTIDLCFNHMTNPLYPGIIINLGGDMLSGDIHEELTETNELPVMATLFDLFDKLVWAIGAMADRFGNVFLPGAVGNHGRNTRKPRMKDRVYSNFDWVLYQMLERHFRSDPRIVFWSPLGTDVTYNVYNHRYLLTHGDALGVKGGDGIIGALGPILRGTFKTANAASAMGEPFDTILMGHWHQYISLRGLIVNGALKGYDEFAKAMRFRPDYPEQALWFTHPKHGITCAWPVKLGGLQTKSTAPWVSFPEKR